MRVHNYIKSQVLLLFSHFANYIFTFSGSRQFDTFSVDMFDTFSGSRQFDTFSVDTFDTFSEPDLLLTHLA